MQLQISPPHPAKSLRGRKSFWHQDSGLGQPFRRLLLGWVGVLLHGEEEARAQLDAPLLGAHKLGAPLLGAHKDRGSLRPVSAGSYQGVNVF